MEADSLRPFLFLFIRRALNGLERSHTPHRTSLAVDRDLDWLRTSRGPPEVQPLDTLQMGLVAMEQQRN